MSAILISQKEGLESPGVYDIHSPRCPSAGDMAALIAEARQHLAAGQIWINPDCGLKTRKWDEVKPALKNMVEAAQKLRAAITKALSNAAVRERPTSQGRA
jgi:methionine synthase II (cobalamin-independent)